MFGVVFVAFVALLRLLCCYVVPLCCFVFCLGGECLLLCSLFSWCVCSSCLCLNCFVVCVLFCSFCSVRISNASAVSVLSFSTASYGFDARNKEPRSATCCLKVYGPFVCMLVLSLCVFCLLLCVLGVVCLFLLLCLFRLLFVFFWGTCLLLFSLRLWCYYCCCLVVLFL